MSPIHENAAASVMQKPADMNCCSMMKTVMAAEATRFAKLHEKNGSDNLNVFLGEAVARGKFEQAAKRCPADSSSTCLSMLYSATG